MGRPLMALCRALSSAVHSSDNPRRKSAHNSSSRRPLQYQAALSHRLQHSPEGDTSCPSAETLCLLCLPECFTAHPRRVNVSAFRFIDGFIRKAVHSRGHG